MGFIIGLLTFILVLDCVALVLLVLVQLPKKDAGAGLAFGGAASDALFGAGSGNVLTKITKYAAGIFFVLAIGLSLIQNHYRRGSGSFFGGLTNAPSAMPGPVAPAAIPATTGTNVTLLPPGVESTNIPSSTPPPVPAGTNAESPAGTTNLTSPPP